MNREPLLIHPGIILAASMYLEADFQGYTITGRGEIISPTLNTPLRPEVVRRRDHVGHDLRVKIKGKKYRIHRLMAHVFFGMPLRSKKQVNHLDRDTSNNCLWNFEIVTQKKNQRHWRKTAKTKQ